MVCDWWLVLQGVVVVKKLFLKFFVEGDQIFGDFTILFIKMLKILCGLIFKTIITDSLFEVPVFNRQGIYYLVEGDLSHNGAFSIDNHNCYVTYIRFVEIIKENIGDLHEIPRTRWRWYG